MRFAPKARGQELGYAEITADFGGTGQATAETDITGLSVTVVCDGVTPVMVESWCPTQKQTNAGAVFIYLYMDATVLAAGGATLAINDYSPIVTRRRLIPSAGTHVFKARYAASSVGGRIDVDTTNPAFISVSSR